ncbi:GNAT family N-acetyltransferase [Thalassococcus sp. S3]|uniref:GNAT family N-acetyltransferase n=1 Tax=Thalassococcus sp. S3 TaxID=2017482 RepID=UPI001C2B7D61|nr:GNAT family N-acetyltransferase [Thalassococcus sp. S3]
MERVMMDTSLDVLPMPCGTKIDLKRARSAGPLTTDQVVFCRNEGVPLAYDPLQIGWVPLSCIDDISPDATDLQPEPVETSETLTLRPWQSSDLDVFHDLLDDPKVWTHMPQPYPAPLTRDAAEALLDLSISSNHHEVRAVLHQDRIVGQVRLQFDGTDDALGDAEISYWLGHAFWGQGIGSMMVSQFTQRSFVDHPSLTSIFARVMSDNHASRAVLRKAGYQEKGPDPKDPAWIVMQRRR